MITGPMIMRRAMSIKKNQNKEVVVLPYSNDPLFYLSLDKYIDDGRRIKITFENEKMTETSALIKRIEVCKNGKPTAVQVVNSLKKMVDIFVEVGGGDVHKAFEDAYNINNYASYDAQINYDEELMQYILKFIPSEGSDRCYISPLTM